MTAWVKEIREDELSPVAMMAQGTWKRYVSVEEGCKFVRGLIGTVERIGKAEIEKVIATRQVTEMMALVNKELFGL